MRSGKEFAGCLTILWRLRQINSNGSVKVQTGRKKDVMSQILR